jgi:uncharacterized protein YprB with RNaseH-like and TPR domain
MQLEAQDFLRLVEGSNKIAFLDIEATGLRGDYNSVLVVSICPFEGIPQSWTVKKPGNDKQLVRDVRGILEDYECWVTYYGRGFDIPMLNTRLLRWEMEPIEKRPHVDMYYTLKSNILTARRSQAHLLRFLGCDMQKMDVSPNEWNKVVETGDLKTMIARCESDTEGLRSLYNKARHLIRDISR